MPDADVMAAMVGGRTEGEDTSSEPSKEQETQSGDAASYDPKTDPHSSVKTRDGRERRSIKTQEFNALSNDHDTGGGEHHGAEPFKRMLADHIERAFHRIRAMREAKSKRYRKNAPFRITIKKGERTERAYFHHGTDVMKAVADCIVPLAREEVQIKVQKRVGNSNRFHSGSNQPHRCARLSMDEPWFGLERFIQTYHWQPQHTRLPELDFVKTMAS